jgi:hypothetical protein
VYRCYANTANILCKGLEHVHFGSWTLIPCRHWGIVKVLKTAFADKHWLLTWAHKLTKTRRKIWLLCLHFSVSAVGHSLAVTLESREDRIPVLSWWWRVYKPEWRKLPPRKGTAETPGQTTHRATMTFLSSPDFSPEVMTGIITPESLPNLDWDNEQPAHTVTWDSLCRPLTPCPNFFSI